MNKEAILRLTLIALFSALSFVLTSFAIIPYAAGGYFSFGDIISLLGAMVLGPLEGAAIGMIAGSMGDLYAGYAVFAPFSLLAKGLMGLVTGILFRLLRNKKAMRFISPFIGEIFMVLTYMLAYYVLFGEGMLISSVFDLAQGIASSIIVIPLYLALEKAKAFRFLNKS